MIEGASGAPARTPPGTAPVHCTEDDGVVSLLADDSPAPTPRGFRAPRRRGRVDGAGGSSVVAPNSDDRTPVAGFNGSGNASAPASKRRRVSDGTVVDLTSETPVVVLGDSPELPSRGTDEVQVVGVRPAPSAAADEVEVLDSRGPPTQNLWSLLAEQSMPAPSPSPTSGLHRRRSVHRRDRGQSSRGPSSSRNHASSSRSAAAQADEDRASMELARRLQEDEDRRAAMRAMHYDAVFGARLDALHAQEEEEEEEEEDAGQGSDWRGVVHAQLARSRMAEAIHRARNMPPHNLHGASSSRGPPMGSFAWSRGLLSPASPGFADGLFGALFGQVQHLTDHAQALRQARGGRLPAHMLLSDRDFDENDYEALLALDEGVANRKGASKQAINQLPTEKVAISTSKRPACASERCTVCLEEPQAGETLRTLPCLHKFHKQCIDQWLSMKACCPICQRDING